MFCICRYMCVNYKRETGGSAGVISFVACPPFLNKEPRPQAKALKRTCQSSTLLPK